MHVHKMLDVMPAWVSRNVNTMCVFTMGIFEIKK